MRRPARQRNRRRAGRWLRPWPAIPVRSLRARLLAGVLIALVVLLAAFGSGVYLMARRSMRAEFDAGLLATAQALAAAVETEPGGGIDFELDPALIPEFQRDSKRACFQIWNEDGRVLARSESLGEKDLERFGDPDEPDYDALRMPTGRRGRAVALRFDARAEADEEPRGPGRTLTLVVARHTGGLDNRLKELAWVLLGAGGATALLALAVAELLVRRGLRPVRRLADGIAAVEAGDLNARVDPGPLPTELAPVREKLNDLLARLQQAFERERAFAADVAHELRTPLAGLRASLEVSLARPRPADQHAETAGQCLAITRDMQRLVENLLALARLEAGQLATDPRPVALGAAVDEAWAAVAENTRDAEFTNAVAPAVRVYADPGLAATVLSNLLANAAEYVDAGGSVDVSADPAERTVQLTVSNSGCDLTDEQVAQVFDRFWRADASRTAAGLHCGLGLSLVRRAVQAAGGTVRASVRDGTFVVELTLPRPADG